MNDSQKVQAEKVGGKRKIDDGDGGEEAGLARKRRKENDVVVDNVVYLPFEERVAPLPPKVPDGCQFALLPDWKERFPEKAGEGEVVGEEREMPADMRWAAEGEDEDDEEEEGEEGEEMEVDPEEEQGAEGLDQDVVMQVLRQKLADSGLGDVDEAVFKDAIAQMLSGEGGGDDAVGGLASLLLGQKGGSGEAFQGFLAGQGVQFGGEEGDDDDNENDDNDDDNDSRSATTTAQSAAASRPTRGASSHIRPSKAPQTRSPATVAGAAATATKPPTHSPPTTRSAPSKTPRKRRAPSLEEASPPQPSSSNSTTKPSAKRRRTPGVDAATSETDVPPVSVAGGRTTRSSAAAGAGAGKRGS